MKSLDVDIEHGIRIHEHSTAFRDHLCEALLIIAFDLAELRTHVPVIRCALEVVNLIEVEYPTFADGLIQ